MRGPQFFHGINVTSASGGLVAASAINERRWVTMVMCVVVDMP